MKDDLIAAAERADWQQVVQNGGPPCFHIEDGRFCFRAERWAGHERRYHPYIGHPFVTLAAALTVQGETAALELELRREWWMNHGTDCCPYGDDGEMQCCALDFKREPLDTLQLRVQELRLVRAAKAWNAYQKAHPETFTAQQTHHQG